MAAQEVSHYKLVFFVPETHKEAVKTALFAQGTGQYQGYDRCSWETHGPDQFRALAGSDPFIGQTNVIEKTMKLGLKCAAKASILK